MWEILTQNRRGAKIVILGTALCGRSGDKMKFRGLLLKYYYTSPAVTRRHVPARQRQVSPTESLRLPSRIPSRILAHPRTWCISVCIPRVRCAHAAEKRASAYPRSLGTKSSAAAVDAESRLNLVGGIDFASGVVSWNDFRLFSIVDCSYRARQRGRVEGINGIRGGRGQGTSKVARYGRYKPVSCRVSDGFDVMHEFTSS